MDNLKAMKDQIISVVQGQLTHLDCVDTKELGEAVDIIKDLSEAAYYCSITKAMEETEKNGGGKAWDGQFYEQEPRYYTPMMRYPRDWEEPVYYGGNGGSSQSGTSSYARMGGRRMYEPYMSYMDAQSMVPAHDYREGRSYNSRKGYMESKEMHQDPAAQMKELEKYMKDLSQDITEMIMDATPAEKQTLKQKMTALIEKIN